MADQASVYREFTPHRTLSGLIACTWQREVTDEAAEPNRVLPDGCVDVVWDEVQGLRLAGPDTGPVMSQIHPGSVIVGLRFPPGLAGTALGLPAKELRDQRVQLEEVWGADARRLEARLAAARSADERRAILEGAMLERLPDLESPDPLVLAAVQSLGRPDSRVGELSDELFISERHLRRRFHEAVGYGPKTLDRVLRFRRFLALGPKIARSEEDLAGAAAELGYADQAHLTRECVRLAGLTPRRLIESWS